jgi:quinolinate synthase
MKLNTLEKLYNCLKYETPELFIPDDVQKKAIKPIRRMLEISAKLGL